MPFTMSYISVLLLLIHIYHILLLCHIFQSFHKSSHMQLKKKSHYAMKTFLSDF